MLIVAAVFSLLLGLSFLIGNQRNRESGVFFFMLCVGTSVWAVNHSLFDILPIDNPYLWYVAQLLYVGAALIPISLFHFAVSMRQWIGLAIPEGEPVPLKPRVIHYFSLAVFAILQVFILFTPFILTDISVEGGVRQVIFGNYHFLYVIYIMAYFVAAFYYLILNYKQQEGHEKLSALYILVGTGITAAVGTTSNLVLPYFGNFTYYWLGPSVSLSTVFIVGYAIMRHNILDYKSTIAQAYAYLIPVIGLGVLFFVRSVTELIALLIVLLLLTILSFLLLQQIAKESVLREKGERLARYLANANARLRELDKQKTEFVSIASHQLRSPIAAIKGYASLISEGSYGKIPQPVEEPISRILESGQRIAIMVDDFLNVTRIEQGRMNYSMAPQNVCEVAGQAVEELTIIAEKKGLNLSITCDDGGKHPWVSADEGKLKQIFSNLIDNALKYTTEGGITVNVKRDDENKKVLVAIKDTGIGIAPEEVPKLFQKFNRASNANQTNVLGTGLGLYIAREIMKAHEGWIHLESPGLGKGSTFTVELPMIEPPKDSEKITE